MEPEEAFVAAERHIAETEPYDVEAGLARLRATLTAQGVFEEDVPRRKRRWPDRTICRMVREDRFMTVRPYLHRDVIVRAEQNRTPSKAESYAGRVIAVAWGVEGGNDTLVLAPTTPRHVGLPVLSIELTRILSITPKLEESE